MLEQSFAISGVYLVRVTLERLRQVVASQLSGSIAPLSCSFSVIAASRASATPAAPSQASLSSCLTQLLLLPCRFHNTAPLPGFEGLTNSKAAEQVVHSSLRTVPYPLLRENTFVLSDSLTLSPLPSGNLGLSFRVG